MEVEPGEARLISSAALLAEDADTPSTDVSYRIQSVPSQGLLQLKVRTRHASLVFLCEELCFAPPGSPGLGGPQSGR